MSELIRLKSKLLQEGDPWKIDLSQFQVPLTVDQALYERDLLNFRRRYAVTKEAQEIAAQDMVKLSCISENPRFCKEHITIRVGMGLFSRELENQLLGWKLGQTGVVTVKNQSVTVTVEGISRETLPEVDDALAARCGIPGIQTAQDICSFCRGKQFDQALEGPADEAFAYLSRAVLDDSEYDLDPEEVHFSQEKMVQELNHNSQFRETGMDGMPEETFRELFGCGKEELVENMRISGVLVLKSALLGQAMLEREGKLLTMADYEAYLRRYLEAGDDEEKLRREKPLLGYVIDTYGDYFMNAMEELALHRLEEAAV